MLLTRSSKTPEAGDVYCLFNSRGTQNEYSQFVRITRIENEETYTEGSSSYRIITVSISDPLEVTFEGIEYSSNFWTTAPTVYTTVVSDAAKYYGVMKPTEPINAGDVSISVESIYTQLVPTSQGESPMIDQRPGYVGTITKTGNTRRQTFASQTWTQINLGQPFVPGTLVLDISGLRYTESGDGVLMQGGNQAGTIEYSLGRITLSSSKTGEVQAEYDPGVNLNNVGSSLLIPVLAASRGYNYVAIMWPLPLPGSIVVDYMAEGKWYRLRDNGAGDLVPDIERTGSGRINYSTGQMSITTGALPDIDVPLLVFWGCSTEIIQLQGRVEIDIEPVHHTLANAPVAPGTVRIEWPVGVSETAVATDDGHGKITGDAIGWINYGNGELYFKPTRLPLTGSNYTIDHDKYAPQVWVGNGSANVLTIPNAPLKPGTLSITMPMSIGGWTHPYQFRDDGNGRMGAEGFNQELFQCSSNSDSSSGSGTVSGGGYSHGLGSGSSSGGSSSSSNSYDSSESNKSVSAGPISATIDYLTGQVVFDLTEAVGIAITTSSSEGGGSGSSSSYTVSSGQGNQQ